MIIPSPQGKGEKEKDMTKRELKTIAYGIGISEAHKKQRIVAAAQCPEMMEFIKKNANSYIEESIPLLKAFNAGVAAEIHQQTILELGEKV